MINSFIGKEQEQRLLQIAKACPVSKTCAGAPEMIVEINKYE